MHQVSSASQTVSSSYLYNLSNQRTNATAADGSYWVYAYDDHGQVVSGKRYWADGTLVAGQQFEYGFDDIGNRTNTSSGGDDQGNNMRGSSYTTNYQNEVTQLVVPSYEEIQGTANELATVTVNGLNTYRKGEYFRYELPVSNSSGAAYSAVSVISSISGLSDTTSGNVYSPPASEWCYYDDDGNLTYDGRWYYTWNAENRLVAMQAGWVTSGSQALRRRLEFKYDGQGRRIEKRIYKYNTSTYSFSDLLESWTYVYDGWNLIAEIRKAPYYDGIRRSYMWGPDLSGSMQGAGGVGGLLMITDHTGVSHEDHYVGYDGNGNVTVLVDANIGTITGRYEYGPFGEPLRASGEAIAIENPFRFSTKFTDKESGYLYYGFRYYNPETGRWLNRDPIAEKGGLNLYGFVANNPINGADHLGMRSLRPSPIVSPRPPIPGIHPRPLNPFFRDPEPIFGRPTRPGDVVPPRIDDVSPISVPAPKVPPTKAPIVEAPAPPEGFPPYPPKCKLWYAVPPHVLDLNESGVPCSKSKCWFCVYKCTNTPFPMHPIARFQKGGCVQEPPFGWVPGWNDRQNCENSKNDCPLPYLFNP